MSNLNKKYKELFDKIQISDNKSKEIYERIVSNKKEQNNSFNPILVTSFIIIVCIISIGIVFAKEIKGFFLEITKNGDQAESYHLYGNDYVKIKETNSDISNKGSMTITELEELLGIKLLKNDRVKNDTLINYEFTVTNNKISRVKLEIENYIHNENTENSIQISKNISVNIDFITQFATEKDIEVFKAGIKANGIGIETYSVDELSVNAYIFDRRPMTGLQTTWFAYNNMLYSLQSSNMTTDELIEIVKTLK